MFQVRVISEDKEVRKIRIYYGEVPLPNVSLTFKKHRPDSHQNLLAQKKTGTS